MKITIEVSPEVLARLDALVPGKQIDYADFVAAMFLAGQGAGVLGFVWMSVFRW